MKSIGIYCLDQDRATTSTLGVYHYTRRLIDSLARLPDPGFKLYLLLSSKNAADFTPPNVPEWMRVVIVRGSFGTGARRLFADHLLTIHLARKYKLDAMHFPKGWIPLLAMRNTAVIATVHDVIPVEMITAMKSASITERLKRHYFKAILVWSLNHSDCILTISRYSQKQILSLCPLSQQKIHVTRLGPGLPVDDQQCIPLGHRKFFFVIGSTIPHKATEETLRLLDRYAARENLLLEVQVAGMTALPDDWEIPLDRLRIHWLGRIPDEEMVTVMSHARAMLFLSSVEGAGLPLIEGYILKTPVIFRNIAPMNEFVDPQLSGWDGGSEDAFCCAMKRALALDDEMLERARKSLLETCSWTKVAERIAEIYQQALRA